jgi:dienelactone hydrolase
VAQTPYRTLNDTFAPPAVTDAAAWKQRAAYLRERILWSAGLLPMPVRNDLKPTVFGEIKRADYSVAKVHFESLPGFFVTGNLYLPAGPGPFPAILTPHGHWAYGRLENTSLNSVPGRAINLARQGYVVFTYDMVGYGDSRQLPHTFDGKRETLWGLSLAGLQLWNAIRALDFLESLPMVQRDAIGATGESGGGTQTFLLSAVDPRVKVAVPVNMISLHMQGGCLCENPPGLRLDTTNVEIAATIAPRPLLMVAATGDWTKNTLEQEFPAVRSIYELLGARDRVHAVRFDAEHNYNKDSREAMYAWMARWLKGAPADTRVAERSFTPEPPADLLVFHQRALPSNARTAQEIADQWIQAAAAQRDAGGDRDAFERALAHTLGYADRPLPRREASFKGSRVVLVGDAERDGEIGKALRAAGFKVQPIRFTPFDTAAAEPIRHFHTYNRTPAAQRVADIVNALRANPRAAVVASGDAALAAILASAVEHPAIAVLDVDQFDTHNDNAYVERLFIPGLRRAGDIETAFDLVSQQVRIHNAGQRFDVDHDALRIELRRLSAREIVDLLRRHSK